MDITSISRAINPADLPFEDLAANKNLTDQEKVGEASRQFEAMLLRQILSQAQKPLFGSSLMGSDSSTNAIYQDMITDQLADRISRGGSFGIATVVEQQLSSRYIEKEPEPASDAPADASAKPTPGKRL